MKYTHIKAAALAAACAVATPLLAFDAYQPERIVPGKANDHAFLGSVYDIPRDNIVNQLCVGGESVDTQGDTIAEYKLIADLSFRQAYKTLNGSVSGELNYPIVRAGAGAHLAEEFADTSSTKSFHMFYRMQPKKRVLDPRTLWLTEYGKKVAESGRDIYEACGDSFITGKEFGGSIHASLKFNFRNTYDKQNIGGHIKIGKGAGKVKVVKLEGSLDFLDEKTANSVGISIIVKQFGGDPTRLSKIIVPEAVHCKLTDASKCLEAFEAVSRYAKEDFPNQFKTLDDYNTKSYFVNTYKKMGVKQLVPKEEYPQVAELTKIVRAKVEADYVKNMMYEKQAEALLSQYRGTMKDSHIEKLKELEENAFFNARVLAEISAFCYDKPFLEECKGYKDRHYPRLRAINDTILKVAAPQTKFYKCENARIALAKTGEVPNADLLRYRKAGWAPIFDDNRYPRSYSGFVHCEEALPTYGKYFENAEVYNDK